MSVIFLDTGPLGMVTNPNGEGVNGKCAKWLMEMSTSGREIVVPEIADYELRRELIRGGKIEGLKRLDALEKTLVYSPISTGAMRKAAEFWAKLRHERMQSAPDLALDADVILAAQAISFPADGRPVVIATTNQKHLDRLTDARHWSSIR